MTTYDLDTLTLTNVGEDVNDENRAALSGLLLSAYNEAYFFVCNTVLKPEAVETVRLDGSRRFDPAALAYTLGPDGIVSVTDVNQFMESTGFRPAPSYGFRITMEGKVIVPAAPAGMEVVVTYRRAPTTLVNETPKTPGSGSVPELLPAEYHSALSSYAAAAFFRVRRKFERMQVWMDAWKNAVQELQGRAKPESLSLLNAFVTMP